MKQVLNHGLVLQKVDRVIEFTHWLNPYIAFNASLITKAKYDFEKGFFKLMYNVRKHTDIKIITTEEEEVI